MFSPPSLSLALATAVTVKHRSALGRSRLTKLPLHNLLTKQSYSTIFHAVAALTAYFVKHRFRGIP